MEIFLLFYKCQFLFFLLSGVPLCCINQNIPSMLLGNGHMKRFVSDFEKSPTETICVCSMHWLTIWIEVLSYNIKHLKWCRCFFQRQGEMANPFQNYMKMLSCSWGSSWQKYSNLLHIFEEKAEIIVELTQRYSMKGRVEIQKLLRKFRLNLCDQFFDRSFNLLRQMENCSENTQHKYPTRAYKLSETLLLIFLYSISSHYSLPKTHSETPFGIMNWKKCSHYRVESFQPTWRPNIFLQRRSKITYLLLCIQLDIYSGKELTINERKSKLFRTGTGREIFGYSTIGSSGRYPGTHLRGKHNWERSRTRRRGTRRSWN